LTGVLKWFLFQNENFPKADATAGVLRMHSQQPTWYSAVIAVKCDFLILFALIADNTRAGKCFILKKKQRKSKQNRKTGASPFFL